jgi:hypothetical protein
LFSIFNDVGQPGDPLLVILRHGPSVLLGAVRLEQLAPCLLQLLYHHLLRRRWLKDVDEVSKDSLDHGAGQSFGISATQYTATLGTALPDTPSVLAV